jgi:hypothetical protein
MFIAAAHHLSSMESLAANAVVAWLLFIRFERLLRNMPDPDDRLLQDLDQFVGPSGGDMHGEGRALAYMLKRGYAGLPDPKVVRAGDRRA